MLTPPSPEGLEAEGFSIQRTKGKDATTIFVVAERSGWINVWGTGAR